MYWKKKREMEAFHTICKQFFKRFPLGTFLNKNRTYIFYGLCTSAFRLKAFCQDSSKKRQKFEAKFFFVDCCR